MIWEFLILAAIAIGLIRLGALSVWVAVLSLLLKIMLALAFYASASYSCGDSIENKRPFSCFDLSHCA